MHAWSTNIFKANIFMICKALTKIMKILSTKIWSYTVYCIVGYLHGVQFLWMSLIYHEPVIFTDVLLAT